MVVPTTKRQYYDTTKKVSSLAEYSGAIGKGAEAWGNLLDNQQKTKIAAGIDTANENIKNEFARKSPEYDNNPDNPEFKQYMDDFRKNEYEKVRQDIMPIYRGQFDEEVRQGENRYNAAFEGWKIKQRQANASNDVKKLSQSLIDEAYLAGQTGAIEDAMAQFNKKVPLIRSISTATLGARATEQGIEDLGKRYQEAVLSGMLESNPVDLAAMLSGENKIDDPMLVKKYKDMALKRIKTLDAQKKDEEILKNANIENGLLQQSVNGNLSIQDIQSQMPENASDDYKALIYRINGYETSEEKEKKVSTTDKALARQQMSDEFVALISNPNTTVEDFQKYQNKVYENLGNGKIALAEGRDFLNKVAVPTMNAWKTKLKEYGADPFFSKAYGIDALNDWIEDSVLGKEPKESQYKNRKAELKDLQAGRANIKSDLYNRYWNALSDVAGQEGYQDISELLTQPVQKQKEIYNKAVDIVQKSYGQDKFSSLRNTKSNPTYVLSGDNSMTQVANNAEDTGNGKQLNETRIVNTAYDPERNVYGVQFADGTIKEVGYEEYKKYGGSR